jgi:hypothetical protein
MLTGSMVKRDRTHVGRQAREVHPDPQAGAGSTSRFNKKNVMVKSRMIIRMCWEIGDPGFITTPFLKISFNKKIYLYV